MRRFVLVMIFLAAFVVAAVAMAPLSFFARQSNLAAMGIGWQQARGTVWNGQLVGVAFRGVPLGSVSLASTPLNLVRGRPVHQATWRDGPSRAVADVAPAGQGVAFENLSAELLLKQFAPGIASAYSLETAHIRLKRASATYDARGCRSVSGAISSDVAQELGGKLGVELPELVGTVICDGGKLKAHLEGQAGDGTLISLDILEGKTAIMILEGLSQDLAAVMTAAGFEVSGTRLEHVIPLTEEQ
ncbi:MAG: type II secretion system protein N [Hyphomonas sp.]